MRKTSHRHILFFPLPQSASKSLGCFFLGKAGKNIRCILLVRSLSWEACLSVLYFLWVATEPTAMPKSLLLFWRTPKDQLEVHHVIWITHTHTHRTILNFVSSGRTVCTLGTILTIASHKIWQCLTKFLCAWMQSITNWVWTQEERTAIPSSDKKHRWSISLVHKLSASKILIKRIRLLRCSVDHCTTKTDFVSPV